MKQIYLKSDGLFRPAIFVDRDGTLIKDPGHLTKIEQVKLYPPAVKGIKLLNQLQFTVIVITNQSVVARGKVSVEDLRNINDYIRNKFYEQGAIIDAIFSCPHHPDFSGSICQCRKPGIALCYEAATQFNLDLKTSYFIGDSTIDIQTGSNLGITTIGLRSGYGCQDKKYMIVPNYITNNLFTAAKLVSIITGIKNTKI